MNLIMLKNFSHEMKCAMFAGSIFLIFFTSSLVSVARGEAIAYEEAYSIPVDVNEEFYPPEAMPDPVGESLAPTDPDVSDAIQPNDPQIGDPSPFWATRINIWFQNLSNFYDSILSVLGI